MAAAGAESEIAEALAPT